MAPSRDLFGVPSSAAVVKSPAVAAVANAARPLTPRSKSPTTITTVWAAATIPTKATDSRMFVTRFVGLKNVVG